MNGTYLKFYVQEKRRLHGILAYEWLLEKAKSIGIHGGSAFRAIAGYGRHGHLHEDTFFELAGELPVQVEFILPAAKADAFLAELRGSRLNLFYVRYAVESGAL